MSDQSSGGWGPPPGFSPQPPGYGAPGQGYGPPAGGFGAPAGYGWGPPGGYGAPPPPPQPASSRAVGALICSILGWVMCGCLTSIPGTLLAWSELKSIELGEAPAAGKHLAQIAFWVGLVNAILYVLVLGVYVVIFAFAGAGAFI